MNITKSQWQTKTRGWILSNLCIFTFIPISAALLIPPKMVFADIANNNTPSLNVVGKWIGSSADSNRNSWYCFRKQVDLDNTPQKAIARIACDSKYWLWINDELVIFEGQLKRGPIPQGTYFDEVDLTNFLKKGNNTIAVLVWYWGKHGFSHNSSGKAGLVFDAIIDDKTLVSDTSWKVKIHPAYGSTDKPHPNYRLAEANIQFDAQQDMMDWQGSNFDDGDWSNAFEFGNVPTAPWGSLEKRPILQWKNSGLIDYVNMEIKQNKDGTQTVIGQLPYNCQVTPYLKVKSPAGQTINIQTDNYKGGGPENVRSVYITKTGEQEYESLGWMNGHDVRYTLPKEVKVLAVKYRETGYNADFDGRFKCDDEILNRLWEKSKRTLYVTMRDNYMDCPDRERAQWWGDAVNEIGEAFYVFDAQKGPLLAKKGIYELARWQRPDKVIFSPVPAGIPAKPGTQEKNGAWSIELPRQMLASVGWYGFWTYYWYTGDKQTIVDVYPHVRDYLSLWKIGEDGLIIHRRGDWDWTDWGSHKDVPVIENAWVHLAMKAAVEMAKLSGNEVDIPGYRAKMKSIEANFNKAFWQGNRYCSAGYKGQTDDRANAIAVIAGLAKPEYYPAIKKVLNESFNASPYMEKYVLESLCMMDAPQQALERMKQRWSKQIESPLTTLWEGWGGGTYNHAWSGGPLTILSQYIAGVSPIKPGFEQFSVLPQMASLKKVKSVVPTKYGDIKLALSNEAAFEMTLEVPTGTTAIAGVPKTAQLSKIHINGEKVYQSGNAFSDLYLGEDDHWIKFSLNSGRTTIIAK